MLSTREPSRPTPSVPNGVFPFQLVEVMSLRRQVSCTTSSPPVALSARFIRWKAIRLSPRCLRWGPKKTGIGQWRRPAGRRFLLIRRPAGSNSIRGELLWLRRKNAHWTSAMGRKWANGRDTLVNFIPLLNAPCISLFMLIWRAWKEGRRYGYCI